MTPPLPPDVEPCAAPDAVYRPPLWLLVLAAALWIAPIAVGYAVGAGQCEAVE